MPVHRRLPSNRALLLAAVPGVIVAGIFGWSLGFPVWLAAPAGLGWFAATLLVTCLLYDDAAAEVEAWRAAAPDLATPRRPTEPQPERPPTAEAERPPAAEAERSADAEAGTTGPT